MEHPVNASGAGSLSTSVLEIDPLRRLFDVPLNTAENGIDLAKRQEPREAPPIRKLEGENDGAAVLQCAAAKFSNERNGRF